MKYLIVGPASLRPNWTREVRKYLDEPTYQLLGSKPAEVDVIELVHGKHKYFYINYEALAANTKIVDKETNKEETVFPWLIILNMLKENFRVIVDEAHYIKNPSSARSKAVTELKAKSKLLLTGTPMKNGPMDLYALIQNVAPDLAGTYERWKNSHTLDNGKTTKDPKNLHNILTPFMYRLRTAEVYKDLPPINRIPIEYSLTGKAMNAYKMVEEGFYQELAKWDGDKSNSKAVNSILTQMLRMRQICAEDKVKFTCEQAIEAYDSAVNNESEHPKVIIFTQFVNSPPLIGEFVTNLAPHAITTAGITDVSKRMEVVDKFQSDPDIHYLIISRSASEGLNITAASTVINNDLMWTPDDHRQIEGRAYGRVSDLHSIKSIFIVAENTVEEDVVAILAKKLDESSKVVDGRLIEQNSGGASIFIDVLHKIRGRR